MLNDIDDSYTYMDAVPSLGGIGRKKMRPRAVPKTKETTAAATAVREELRKVIDTEPFGAAELLRLAEIADAGGQLLKATRNKFQSAIDEADKLKASGSILGGPANPAETFGAKAIRELQQMIPQLVGTRRSPEQLVRAIAAARKEGLDDVAEELKSELSDMMALDKRHKPEVPAPKALIQAASGCECNYDHVANTWTTPEGKSCDIDGHKPARENSPPIIHSGNHA